MNTHLQVNRCRSPERGPSARRERSAGLQPAECRSPERGPSARREWSAGLQPAGCRSPRWRSAFTLIELLVVMTIISIMLTMAGFALRGTLESQRLSTSATRLAGDLASVALRAVKENRTLEVRLLLEASDFKNDPRYRSYQVWAIDPLTGIASAASEKLKFDNGIVGLQDTTRSNLLQHETPSSLSAGKVYGYALLANGSTDLSKGTNDRWCFTLVSERALAKLPSGKLPPDYRTLVINPHTGAVKVY